MKAAALAPDAILLPVDFDAYRHYSRLFKDAVRAIAPRIEDRGIDEIYIDLTDAVSDRAPANRSDAPVRALAQSIKDAVRAATGLSCSIGVAPNKLLAKIASDLDKPDGLTILGDGDIAATHLAAAGAQDQRHRPQVGGEARERSASVRSATSPQPIRRCSSSTFGGRIGAWMHEAAHGRDDAAGRHPQRAAIDQPRDDVRSRPARGARSRASCRRDLHRAVRRLARRSAAQGLRGQDHRRQAALRQFRDGHARRTRSTSRRRTRDVIRRAAGECLKRVDLTRRHPPARRARRRTRARGRHARGARA